MENEKNSKNATIYIILALVMGAIVGITGSTMAYKKHISQIASATVTTDTKLGAIWSLVDNYYVDPIDADSVMDRVYESILSTLDPHSSYMSKEVFTKEQEVLRGNFEGIGIIIRPVSDTICVAQVIPEGPSERAGLMAGDRILSVDGITVAGVKMPSDSVISMLRGPRKSVADIQILRLSDKKTHRFKIVRDIIKSPSLTYSGMLDKQTGYIRLNRFGETTYDEFREATIQLKREGMKRMVLDLRNNGGGTLSSAIDICDELLPGRELIVYTKGQHQRRKDAHSTPGGLFCKGDLVVMIDEFSASASEIVAGAIQDNDRGIIVGRRSFGKGLVQQQFPLPDQSAVMLTIARYYTPSGRCIQRPYDRGTDEYYSDFVQQVMNEYNGDSLLSQINDSTPYHTSKGRIVYGGGGIMPDKIIRYKTDTNIVYYNKLLNNSIINNYVFDHVSRKGGEIKSHYADEKEFLDNYTVSDDMLGELFELADKKGIRRNDKSIKLFREEIRTRIKAEIGDMLYGSNTFYKLILPYDPEIEDALKEITKQHN